MKDTSAEYKQAVYNLGDYVLTARHFLPEAELRVIDVSGGETTNLPSTESFYSQVDTIDSEDTPEGVLWGTMEDFQFLIGSNALLMPNDTSDIQTRHNGWVTETISNGSSIFESTPFLDRRYSVKKSSAHTPHTTHHTPPPPLQYTKGSPRREPF